MEAIVYLVLIAAAFSIAGDIIDAITRKLGTYVEHPEDVGDKIGLVLIIALLSAMPIYLAFFD